MILVTRLTGAAFAVNPDLLERVEATPDTVLTLIDGTKYLVAETVAEVIELVRDYRASVVASARGWQRGEPSREPADVGVGDHRAHLHLAAAVGGATVTALPAGRAPRSPGPAPAQTSAQASDKTPGQEED